MSIRSKVNKYLKDVQSGRHTRSFVEQYLEEEGEIEILEALQEIWDSPESGGDPTWI